MKQLLLSGSMITLIVMVINFMFKIYLSYVIRRENIGLFYTLMDILAIFIMFFSGFKDSLVKAYDDSNFKIITYYYVILFWGLFIIVLTLLLGYYNFYFYSKVEVFHISSIMIALLFFLNALMIYLSYFKTAHKLYKIMLFENLIMAIGLITSFFLIRIFLNDDIMVLLISFICSFIGRTLYLIFMGTFKLNYQKSSINKEVKSFFKNTFLSSLMYFFSGFFISASSLVFLTLFEDHNALSDYQVVVKSIFFSLVMVVSFPIATFTFPEISKFISMKNYEAVHYLDKKIQKFLILLLILLLLSMLFTKLFIGIVFSKEYIESYKMLNVLLPSLVFIVYTSFSINVIKGFNRFDLALYIRILGSIFFFVSMYVFYMLKFNTMSIVYSLNISFFGMLLFSNYYKKRLLP
jgi:O-antigen/teichoic acid export membrane protein